MLAAFVVSLAAGSFLPVWTYNREQQLTLRQLLAPHDILLMAVCVGSVVFAVGGYAAAVRVGLTFWARVGLLAVAVAAIVAAAARHPLAPEVRASQSGSSDEPRSHGRLESDPFRLAGPFSPGRQA